MFAKFIRGRRCLPWRGKGSTPTAIPVGAGWLATISERRSSTCTSTALQQQLFSRMSQVDFISVLCIVGHLLTQEVNYPTVHLHNGVRKEKATFNFWWFMKPLNKAARMKIGNNFSQPHSEVLLYPEHLLSLLHLNPRSLHITRVPAFIGSNFLSTERSSRCEKRKLNREKCPLGA